MPGIPKGLSDEKAARMMAGFRDGRTLRGCGVLAACFEAYCDAHPEYAREAKALLVENMKASHARSGARLRNRTHCRYGHPFSGDNLYIWPNGKVRECRACNRRKETSGRRMSEEQARRVIEALNEGKT